MTYDLQLKSVGLVIGVLLLAAHLFALIQPKSVQEWLRALPRSKFWGIVFLTIAAVWTWFLVKDMDMGEFTSFKRPLLVLIPVTYVLTIQYVDEFLAVRALGMLCLLAAEPLLCAAFLKPQTSRLLLVCLAYAWIVAGMFWIGMPYLLRDQIGWISKTAARWTSAAVAGVVYGAAVLVFALTQY